MNTTPNKVLEENGASSILQSLKNNPDAHITGANPVQITKCPWCGNEINLKGYSIENDHLHIKCINKNCYFFNKLPIYVVDDDIYKFNPTLIISTIDKFARLAWEVQTKSLFGLTSSGKNFSPPELIIQDELHLISGPLGTLSGLYEIAIDYLCTYNNNKSPKIIASTATIKNAPAQINNLYGRRTFLFPPSGLEHTDSFFSVLSTQDERPARIYLGLTQKHSSIQDLMIRVYSNLIFLKHLFIKQNRDKDIIDHFSTIIGYFNSLKDLGTMHSIITDRISANIKSLVNYKFIKESKEAFLSFEDINIGLFEELTSRKSAKEIKETLKNLNSEYTDIEYYSIVFASNMLSVGIDINRLGLITIYNQPKSNAEYIQATSRIGRQNPGLVVTLYNPSRSRDNSHFEQFNYYHKTFFKYVESTSVTPCSAKSIDKALHCVFIAIIRLTLHYLCDNNSAKNFNSNDNGVRKIINYIIDRIKIINHDSVTYVISYLDYICSQWEYYASQDICNLVYTNSPSNKNEVALISPAGYLSNIDFPTFLNSLRCVELSSNIYVMPR
jgi:hypothetical protein